MDITEAVILFVHHDSPNSARASSVYIHLLMVGLEYISPNDSTTNCPNTGSFASIIYIPYVSTPEIKDGKPPKSINIVNLWCRKNGSPTHKKPLVPGSKFKFKFGQLLSKIPNLGPTIHQFLYCK